MSLFPLSIPIIINLSVLFEVLEVDVVDFVVSVVISPVECCPVECCSVEVIMVVVAKSKILKICIYKMTTYNDREKGTLEA